MTVYIGNAVGDEHGGASGGEAGNQTGKELRIQPWYKSAKGWLVFRPKSEEVAQKLVYDMTAACNNPNIGYDQKQRNTLYNVAKSVGFDCAKVSEPCECDCSSLVRVCLAYAGINTKNFSTATEANVLLNTGKFEEITEHTDSPDWLTAGSVLLTCTKGHTAIVLNDGPKAHEPEPAPTAHYVEVIGKSVNVRNSDSKKGRIIYTAHKGDMLPFEAVAPSGWYEVMTSRGSGYITNKPRYTRLV